MSSKNLSYYIRFGKIKWHSRTISPGQLRHWIFYSILVDFNSIVLYFIATLRVPAIAVITWHVPWAAMFLIYSFLSGWFCGLVRRILNFLWIQRYIFPWLCWLRICIVLRVYILQFSSLLPTNRQKQKKMKWRDFTGPEKLVLFSKIEIPLLLPNFSKKIELQELWDDFIKIYDILRMKDSKVKFDYYFILLFRLSET